MSLIQPLLLGLVLTASPIVDPGTLKTTFRRLRDLSPDSPRRVSIVHIGEAQVQSGNFTGEIRRLLQARFGDAGRGLVFPWEAAGTNGSKDIRSASPVSWKSRGVAGGDAALAAGLSGWGMLSPEGAFALKVEVRGGAGAFDRVRLFAEQGPGWAELVAAEHPDRMILEKAAPAYAEFIHVVQPGETLFAIARSWDVAVDTIRAANGLGQNTIYAGQSLRIKRKNSLPAKVDRDSFIDRAPFRPSKEGGPSLTAELPGMTEAVFVLPRRGSLPGDQALIYGLSLEKAGVSGLLYHALGANGAGFKKFSQASTLLVQLPELEPDLVIVSLGSVEALGPSFDSKAFRGQVRGFLEALRGVLAHTPILLMSPPDGLAAGGGEGQAGEAALILRDEAGRAALAYWDLFADMGGKGSIKAWIREGLAKEDGRRLTEKGDLRLAQDFATALLRACDSPLGAALPRGTDPASRASP